MTTVSKLAAASIASRWPTESPGESIRDALHTSEQRWAFRCCLLSPVLAVLAWGLAARYLLAILYLKPLADDVSLVEALRWKPALLVGLLAFCLPWCWWMTLRWPRRTDRWPVAALSSVMLVIAVNLVLLHPRVSWFFVEWALVRTPNPSFARNTLMWEQRNFERTSVKNPQVLLVRLVGSSQIYQGTDLQVLAREAPGVQWEKNCLAGFGPLQYLWLEHILLATKPRLVVCWLSEFDFFREDDLPVSRLRWSATWSGFRRLQTALPEAVLDLRSRLHPFAKGQNWSSSVRDTWSLRGDLADLGVAATVPVWRLRDHFRRVLFHYWENVSRPAVASTTDGPQLALSGDMEIARQSLSQNVGRKRFVETNFQAFARFARDLKSSNVRLLVCEGATHPEATVVYDPVYREETRQRLRMLSSELSFQYLDESVRPPFTADDFADPYHLNETARARFSRFLARVVSEPLKSSQ